MLEELYYFWQRKREKMNGDEKASSLETKRSEQEKVIASYEILPFISNIPFRTQVYEIYFYDLYEYLYNEMWIFFIVKLITFKIN